VDSGGGKSDRDGKSERVADLLNASPGHRLHDVGYGRSFSSTAAAPQLATRVNRSGGGAGR
jgi:hypothetical protein